VVMFTWEIRSRSDISPTTQNILKSNGFYRLDKLFSVNCKFAAILLGLNLVRNFICHFKAAQQPHAMRWVKNVALIAEMTNHTKFWSLNLQERHSPKVLSLDGNIIINLS
jgi:hypothetical protein